MEDIIFSAFPDLSDEQKRQIRDLYPLYQDWNSKINVISRKDMESFYEHHVLHSLAIARQIRFPSGSRILDVGTGGGFPGIPLAILFPECDFTLCDSIGKKIKVVQGVTESLGLKNVTAVNDRVENIGGDFDFIVSRAVTELRKFLPWIKGRYRDSILYLKGGDLNEEIAEAIKAGCTTAGKVSVLPVSQWFDREFFETKKLLIIRK